MLDRRLLRACLVRAPAQPATAFWRALEIGRLVADCGLPSQGRGLDLGCGDGVVTELVRHELGARWSLIGLDPDEQELRLAAARGLYERLQRAEGSTVDAPDGSFDFVLSNSVLEHVEELEPTLREVSRVLRPGGRFVFTVPSERFHQNVGAPRILGRLATGASDRASYHRELDRRLAHVRYLGLEDWRRALAESGLELVYVSSYLTPRETRRWAALSNATSGLLVRVMGGGRAPIELQRRLGVRRSRPPLWIRVIGPMLGRLATLGLDGAEDRGEGSCLLIVADRR